MKTLREQIETLIIWWVSTTIFSIFLTAIIFLGFFVYTRFLLDDPMNFSSNSLDIYGLLATITIGILQVLNKIVIAFWFWKLYRKDKQNAILWAIFGVIGGLLTVLIHIGLTIYEKQPTQEHILPNSLR